MRAFRVSVNGTVVATAGIPGPHVLTAIINSLAGPSPMGYGEELFLRLGGLASEDGDRKARHLDWLKPGQHELKMGDQVLIEIVELDDVDGPVANQAVKDDPNPTPRAGERRLRVAR